MKTIFMIISLLFITGLQAEIRLPAIIGDHMVLQQKSEVKIWGWSNPDEQISISSSWDTAQVKFRANSGGRWEVKIKTPVAGGPYDIRLKGRNEIIIRDVLIGEVWVLGGQSNMEWSGAQNLPQSLEEMPNANNNRIRLFYVSKKVSDYPQDDLHGQWVVCNPEAMRTFSAIGYFFGKKVFEATSYPMGLINSNWGGTPAETWTPSELVESDPVLKEAAAKQQPNNYRPEKPGIAYNAMIYPLIQFSIAGALWYQGESNAGTHTSYQKLFTEMIGAWRKAWEKEFPFYYVQIAPFSYGDNLNGPMLREAQSKSQSYPKTGMVVISDLVDDVKDIHPKNKKDVAARLANMALAEVYGQPIKHYKSPSYKSMVVEKDKLRISFNNAETGLMSKGGDPTEFYIAGEDHVYVPATAKIQGSEVLVWNKNVKNPVSVRFGFNSIAMPNLFSKEGLPVDLFRTR
jgi:sialate O-acetylesterase